MPGHMGIYFGNVESAGLRRLQPKASLRRVRQARGFHPVPRSDLPLDGPDPPNLPGRMALTGSPLRLARRLDRPKVA